jgi:hypothetical protein
MFVAFLANVVFMVDIHFKEILRNQGNNLINHLNNILKIFNFLTTC